MPRVSMDGFADRDIEAIYIAGTLQEAKRVEDLLTRQGIEFAIKVEPFVRYFLQVFPSEHEGAAFYVLSGQSHYCRRVLSGAGLSTGLIEDSP